MKCIDSIMYLNLEHRKDRLKNIGFQLYESDVATLLPIDKTKIHKIDAIYNSKNGAAGCGESHVKALDLAIQNKWNCVLIFEDDFMWKDNTQYIIDCLKSIDTTNVKWDAILLSTNKVKCKVIRKEENNLQKIENGYTTSGYIIKGLDKIKDLRKCFYDSYNKLKKTNKIYGSDCIDVAWNIFQKRDNWFRFDKNLGTQISSFSDISKKKEDYSKIL